MTKQVHEGVTPGAGSDLDRPTEQGRRPWQTPVVILSTMSQTETGVGKTTDGGGAGVTHS
jgi:hypothetical protein